MLKRTFMLAAATLAIGGPALAAGQCTAYHQSPELDADVASGKLPAVADRLPSDPEVVQASEVGTYGGTLRGIWTGSRLGDYRHYGYEPLVRWSPDGSKVIPNIASSWDITDEGRTYTFHIRKGIKWSDGVPFTADDVMFWWNHVETNKALNPSGPYRIFLVEGQAATVTKVDDMTVSFHWDKPNGRFLLDLASPYGQRVVQYPAHYAKKFDRDLNPDGVAAMMKADGEDNYAKWWKSHVGTYGDAAEFNNPDRPTMLAWMETAPYLDKTHFKFVRNPYYFKVDQDCNQLPYIDDRSFEKVSDPEVSLLKTMAGDFDYSLPSISVPQNKGVFYENQDKGDYHFVEAKSCDYNTMFIELPFNDPDEFKAKFFQNKDVREALSMAIDRPGIINTVYLGQGKPYQSAPRPNSPYYNKQLATQFTDFDPAKANEILDKYYPKKDAQGYRLRPDGKRISVDLIAQQGFRPEWSDVLQVIKQNWADIGIELTPEILSDEAYDTRRTARDRDMQVWVGENGCGQLPTISLARMIRYQSNWDNWIAWINQNVEKQTETVKGVDPVEPPKDIVRLYTLEAKITTAVGDERQKLLKDFFSQLADSFVNIGLVLPEGNYRVISNRIGGVREPLIEGWLYPGPAPSDMEAWFVKKQK